jgi:hypothetical protein
MSKQVIQVNRKVTQPIPDTFSICRKINYIKIWKQKVMLYQLLEMSTAFSDAYISSFPHVWCSPVKSSCVMETVHQTRYCRFFWHRRAGKCIPKLILTSQIRTSYQVVFDNEHSLHLWKRHPCTSAVEIQLTDCHEQVTTWRNLRRLLYSCSSIVRLLIQSNCFELQPSMHFLWVAWLFDRPVLQRQELLQFKLVYYEDNLVPANINMAMHLQECTTSSEHLLQDVPDTDFIGLTVRSIYSYTFVEQWIKDTVDYSKH